MNIGVLLCLNRGTPKCCLDLSNLSGEISATQLTTPADADGTGREKGDKGFKGKTNF